MMHNRPKCRRRAWRPLTCLAWLAGGICVLAGLARSASAHPHVFVTAAAAVNIEQGAITSITHVWTFDEFYTAMAVEGMPKNKAGGYDRETLAELAKVNIDGLKEFGYFTFATLGKTELKVADPAPGDYWLDYQDGVLALHFKLPLEKPVLIEAKGFAVSVYDPSFFIAFELANKDPAKLNDGAPKSCKIEVGVPKDEAEDTKKLTGAFSEQMGGAALGLGVAKSIMVHCTP